MKFSEYQAALKELPFGKKLPDSVYIHIDGLDGISPNLLELITEVRKKLDEHNEFNVLKLHKRQFRISLLCYPDFETSAHPPLERSILADLEKGTSKTANFDQRANPPILHRKEEFLPSGDERRGIFSTLTKAEEKYGLYLDTKTIGFRKNWEKLLSSKGLSIEGHTLLEKEQEEESIAPSIEVDRHKTAIVRYDFSKPVKMLIQSGLLREGSTILDYGCGHGADVTGLNNLGHDVAAWDPVHRPEGERRKSDFVNLGYVINVIENSTERVETLLKAWDYAERILVVSAMVRGGDTYVNARAYGDGVITNSNTFQKYFEQSELQAFIENALHQDAIAAAPGIFFIFRYEADQQDYLANRSRRIIDWGALTARLGFGSPSPRDRTPRLSTYERHRELLDDFWKVYLELARPPHRDEYERSDEVRKACQSIPRAIGLFEDKFGSELIEERRARRIEDLRVYLAEEEFKKRRTPMNKLSPGLRRDIKAFFLSYSEACDEARDLLFAVGDSMELEIAVESLNFGHYDDDEGHFLFHRSLLDELPAILRVYVGCGGMLYGDLSDIDVFKIHTTSGKLTLQTYKGFDRLNLPEMQARIKIDLRRQFIQVFEGQENKTQLLYFKERLIQKDSPLRAKAEAFSRKLERLGLNEEQVGRFGPTKEQLSSALNQMGYSYGLKKISSP
ncbi:DNA phosphorothioation-associated putative methyltransferase [bacterium]|nr:DNA phosphorothioation-associated putative methyltransferase [bacterium]MDB4304712.1 DNA phosphorothioation-associated putative methyltransferase [Akkermansiaceae bacterium]MDB4779197.1 DNA phosphorothioation-associated putative methyltransferase [bacterium]